MNNKRNVFNLIQFKIRTIVLFISFAGLFFLGTVAQANNHQTDELVQINSPQADFTQWQQLVVNPRNTQQFFTIKKTGQMFIVDGMKSTELVLDITVNSQDSKPPIALTAIALHPNFALRDQPGYVTFYTAHLELLDKQSKTKRIQDNNNELELKFDTVVTEWQFSTINHQKVDLDTKREVLRVAVPDNTMTIQQMSFNPSRKSWNDGFGLLYIALNGSDNRQEPLYSGAILRINPAKFGLRSFTVPSSNPFLKTLEIRDEIYSLGAQNIQKFFWSNKSTEKLLLLHRYSDKFLLSLVNIKDDWRKNPPKNVIYQDDNMIKDILLYRGRDLLHLRNKLLILTQASEVWLVQSLNLKPAASSITLIEIKPKIEWRFSYQQLLSKSDVAFGYDINGEVLVLDRTTGKIFQLPHESTTTLKIPVKASIKRAETQKESKNNMYILLIIIIATAGILFFIKRNKISAKAIVRTQFAQLELSESQHQIGLYHRHKSSPDVIIDIIDIVKCEVKLNETSICVINKHTGHGFNNEKDQDLRIVFAKENADKMVNGKIRQVSLSLTDVSNKKYDICLYMRKGSDRVTKKKYSVVINDVVDWCWLIASKINPKETNKRKEKAIVSSTPRKNKTKKTTEQVPLHEQAAMNRQYVPLSTNSQQVSEIKSAVEISEVVAVEASNEVVMGTEQQNTNQPTIDTELVNALEKLVDLKQQGFLTQEEFTKAKENLLSRLFDK